MLWLIGMAAETQHLKISLEVFVLHSVLVRPTLAALSLREVAANLPLRRRNQRFGNSVTILIIGRI